MGKPLGSTPAKGESDPVIYRAFSRGRKLKYKHEEGKERPSSVRDGKQDYCAESGSHFSVINDTFFEACYFRAEEQSLDL